MQKEIYLAGGCFWGTEKYFAKIAGVLETEVGYANGKTEKPTYAEVCHHDTGHAETVKVIYDDSSIRLPFILERYFDVINPVSLNRQGGDTGTQYRTGIYFTDPRDQAVIDDAIAQLQKQYREKIAIEVKPLCNYYRAEDEHQKYLDKNPHGYCHIGPDKFEQARNAVDSSRQYSKKTDDQLRKELTDLQYDVTQHNATEPPFDNAYFNEFKAGIYVDITTGQPLFVSTDKFESGCGWPSFSKPIDEAMLVEVTDKSLRMARTEVRSKMGDAHLGHVFDDGPKEQGGLRYCINSAALKFIPKEAMAAAGYAEYLALVK